MKKLLSLFLTLAIMSSLAMSASAAEPRVINFGNWAGKEVKIVSYWDNTQELNVLTTQGLYNNCDVTLWSRSDSDIYHNFVIYNHGGGKYSIRCKADSDYAVELYYGSSNLYNCDIYDTTRGPTYIDEQDYMMYVSTLNQYYVFYSLYDAANGSFKLTVSGKAAYNADDVRWTRGGFVSEENGWTLVEVA